MFDCIVKGGTLVNGLGTKPETGDLAIKDGIIAEVGGKITGHAARTIDADGAVVTCLLYTSPSPRDVEESRMPSSA